MRPPKRRKSDEMEDWSEFGRLLLASGQSWRRILGQHLADEGLSDASAFALLEIMRAGDGVLHQRGLAARLGLDNSAVVRVLDRLERDNLLRRVSDPEDRRAKRLELTDEGRSIGLKAQRLAERLREQLLGSLAQDDIRTAHRVLSLLSHSLDQIEGIAGRS